MHATVMFASHREGVKCEVFPILRGWGMTSNTRIMHTYVKCMSSIVIMHGPIDHEVSASYSHVSVLTRVYVGSWVDVETVILAGEWPENDRKSKKRMLWSTLESMRTLSQCIANRHFMFAPLFLPKGVAVDRS